MEALKATQRVLRMSVRTSQEVIVQYQTDSSCVVLVCPFAKSQRSQNKPLGHLESGR